MGFWKNVFSKSKGLVAESQQETLHALNSIKEMFVIVTEAFKEQVDPEMLAKVRNMDVKINNEHRDVRKKIYQHLAVSRTSDLFHSLVLLFIMDHVERIGDYNKNIGDLVVMVPGKLDFGEYEAVFVDVKKKTLLLFDLTQQAFTQNDAAAAQKVSELYGEISKTCKSVLRKVMAEAHEKAQVPSFYLSLVLMLRYLRRVGAHLTTISSTITHPFPYIGYRMKVNE